MELLKRLEGMSPKRLTLLALELDARLKELENARTEPIAIIGLGCRMPGGCDSPQAYWDLLEQGRDAIGTVPPDRWDIDEYFDPDPDAPGRIASRWGGFLGPVDQFDAPFFGISRREAVSMDPQQRMLLEVCWEALENAGQSPHRVHGSQTGVYVGIATTDYYTMLLGRGQDAIDAYLATGAAHSVAAGRIAYVLGLQGPNFPIDTACSSSLVAVHLAVQGLRNGECKMALAGGVNALLSPDISIALSRSHMMAPDGRCKAFDASADGFVRAEGCGIVVLKRLSDAVADGDRVLAVIRGSAVNQDGRSSGITAPNGAAQEAVIRQALANAKLQPGDVDYVEAHGTGTSLGDPIEAHALAATLGAGRSQPLVVGSVKTNIGHLESAAGIAGLIKVVLSLQQGQIPRHLHFQKMNPHIDWKGMPVEIPVDGKEWKPGSKPRVAGVSSFGFSGTNAHVILEEAPAAVARQQSAAPRNVHVLALSARSETALEQLAGRYAERLQDTEAGDVCYTANTGRAQFAERAVYIGGSREELQTRLGEGTPWRGRGESAPDVAFLFTGQGAQYAGMGRQLYETEPVFRGVMDACAEAVKDELQPGLIEVLYGKATHLLDETRYTQPAGFALQCALAALWRSWGVEPAVVVGHSVGEYAAACVAGMYTLEEGMRFITARGRLTGGLPAGQGAMAAILAPASRVEEAVSRRSPWVSIAAYNGPESVVIAGRIGEVEAISEEFTREGARVERLRVSHAFHSPLMEEVARQFAREEASRVRFTEPKVTLISTVTGGVVGGEAGQGEHWRRQVRDAVRFEEAMKTAAGQGCRIFVEIGAGSTLLGMGQECIGAEGQLWAPSIRRAKVDEQQMAESLAELYVRGVAVDWEAYEGGRGRRRVAAPTYPFERQRYWLDSRAGRSVRRHHAANPLLGRRTDAAIPVYEGILDLETAPWVADHRVAGSPVAPAAAFLETALAAAGDAFGAGSRAVLALELKDALRVDPTAGAVQLQTVLLPEGRGESSFRIFSRADAAAEWTLHATGRVAAAQDAGSTEDLRVLQQRLSTEASVSSFYDALLARNIELGDAARNIRRLWTGRGEALGEIRLEGSTASAALLDACFQTAGAAVLFGQQTAPAGTYVMQKVEQFSSQALADTVYAHARILSEEHGTITAELTVYDANGARVARATGIRMALFAAAPAAIADWGYRIDWQEKPLAQAGGAPGVVVSDAERMRSLNAQAARLAATHELDRYDALRPGMDRVCAAYIVSALESAGVRFEAGAVIDTNQVGVIAKHRRLFERLLEILAQDGVLRRRGEEWEVARRPASEVPDVACEQLERAFPAFGAELGLLRRCGRNLLEVLRGTADPLQLLAPGGSFESLERLYIHSPAAKVFNPVAAEALKAALEGAPQDRVVRILEVGGGTGGTTTYLAPELAGRNVEYVFTDVSPLFTARAEEAFRDYPFFRYAVLDVEQPAESQGFTAGQFDIIIAANVLHATADLRQTVRNVGRLLQPAGLLLLVEGTQAERWVDLTFGMTEGWWKFADTDLRPKHALLNRSQWMELLGADGYRAALVEPSPQSQQIVLLAEAPNRASRVVSRTLTQPADGMDCDVLVLDGTAGGSSWDLVSTLQAIAGQPSPPRVWLLTQGAQPVDPAGQISPDAAALWGIARTAALEYPQFWGGVIDVEPGVSGVDAVVNEIRSGAEEDQVAYRNGRRFVPRIVREERPSHATPRFDPAGAYLISGGLGNLGFEAAEWLVRHGARHVLLTGRTAARQQRADAIAALERGGATIDVVAADISDAAGIAQIRAALGTASLRGIIHTAAVFDSTPIESLTRETLESVFRPKVRGAENLLQVAGRDLDFFVLFSSTTALAGVRGMAAYAAANAWLDSFAYRARQAGVAAVSVNWGTWELMRDTSAEDRESYRRTGLHPMPADQALGALGDVLASGATQAMVASIDWSTYRAVYQSRRRRPMFDAVADVAPPPEERTQTSKGQPSLQEVLADVPPQLRYDRVLDAVLEEAAAVLGLKTTEVDPHVGLFEMGMDSLMSVELKRRLEARAMKQLPSTLTFNYPNVSALADYLLKTIMPEMPPAEPVAEPASVADDERDDLSESELADLLAKALGTTV